MKCSARVNKITKLVLGLVAVTFLISCSSDLKSSKKDPVFEKWGVVAENSKGNSPSAEPKNININELTAKQVVEAELVKANEKKLPTNPITLNMRQAELKAVLRAMAKSVSPSLNLLLKNEVKGEVTVDFKGVPWDRAFIGLLRTYGLNYVWEGNVILVKTAEDIELELKQKVQLRDITWVEPLLQPVVINVDYADVTKLQKLLEELLTKDKDGKPRGSVKVDEHNNALVISVMRDDLAKMLPIIEKIDKPTAQILIKANIVETTKSTARDLGIKWGGWKHGTWNGQDTYISGGSSAPLGVIGQSNPTTTPTIALNSQRSGLGANFPAGAAGDTILETAGGALGTLGLAIGTIGGNLLEVELQALQKDSKLNIVSSPSITTLDNQLAFTENGKRVPFITSTTSGGTTTQTVTFENAVMRLEITPHVIDGKNLKMKIVVKKDELDFTRAATMYGNPVIIKKLTETSLIVKDGETIVISGLTKETNGAGDAGLPWFKDIPVLGYLGKADNKNNAMEEVLIFITPHILPTQMSQNKLAGDDNSVKSKMETESDKNKTDIPEKKTSVDSAK